MSHRESVEAYVESILSGEIRAGRYVKYACQRYLLDVENAEAKGWYLAEDIANAQIDFIQTLRHTKGSQWAGKPFILSPSQLFICWNLFAFRWRSNNLRRFQEIYATVARKWGKALDLSTPIFTPDGYRTIDEIKPGDTVFCETGNPCRVLAEEYFRNRRSYKIRFTGGEEIIADENHEWIVEERGRKGFVKKKVETKYLVNFKSPSGSRYRIKHANPVQIQPKNLPIDPYVFGYWLGNGSKESARISVGIKDKEEIKANFNRSGWTCRETESTKCRHVFTISGKHGTPDCGRFICKLRSVGVFQNKHIPKEYLYSSAIQRQLLLQGLMDSDGSIDSRGVAEFSNTNKQIAESVLMIARSLGYRASFIETRAMLNGKDCGPHYRIHFTPNDSLSVFKLKRKRDRQRSELSNRLKYTYIESVEEVSRRTTKCISVDSPSRLFLAGHGMIPTHNSTFAAAIACCLLFCDVPTETEAEGYVTGTKEDQAARIVNQAAKMIENSQLRDRANIFRNRENTKSIVLEGDPYQGSYLKPLGSDSRTTDGLNPHFTIEDELHEWQERHRDLLEKLETGSGSRQQPLDIKITTAGSDRSIIWKETDSLCVKVLESSVFGDCIDDSIFAFIARIDENRPCDCAGENRECEYCSGTGEIPGDDPFDEDNWIKANPDIGVTPTIDYMRRMAMKAKNSPPFKNTFVRYHANSQVRSASKLLSPNVFAKAVDPDFNDWSGNCSGGWDIGTHDDLAGIARCKRVGEDFHIKAIGFVPSDGSRDLTKPPFVEFIRRGEIIETDGETTDIREIREHIFDWSDRCGVNEWAFDPANSTQLSQDCESEGIECFQFRQTYAMYNETLRLFLRLLSEGRIKHDGSELLKWCAGNVAKKESNELWMPSKEHSEDKIDPFVAVLMAFRVEAFGGKHKESVYKKRGILAF